MIALPPALNVCFSGNTRPFLPLQENRIAAIWLLQGNNYPEGNGRPFLILNPRSVTCGLRALNPKLLSLWEGRVLPWFLLLSLRQMCNSSIECFEVPGELGQPQEQNLLLFLP